MAALCLAGSAEGQTLLPLSLDRSGHAELALHARALQTETRAEQVAWVALTVPLDVMAAPPRELPVVPRQPAAAGAPMAAPTAVLSGSPIPLEQLRALTDFAQRATSAALTAAGVAAERARLDSLSGRARASALLPELRLRAVRSTDRALRWVPTTDDPYRVSQADGAGILLEASATFRLDRLLFANEELRVEQLRIEAAEQRLKLEARVRTVVLDLYRARERACQKDDEGAEAERAAERRLELLRLLAELDELTASWFLARASSLSRMIWGFPDAILGVCVPPAPAPATPATNPVASLTDSG